MRCCSVAICCCAPAERVFQRSHSVAMAVCRSVRARCSRSSETSSVLASLTRSLQLAGRFLGGGEIGFQRLHAAEGLHCGLGFGKLGVGFERGSPASAPWHRRRRQAWPRFRAPGAPWLSGSRASARGGSDNPARAGAGAVLRLAPPASARRPLRTGRAPFRRRGAAPPPGRQGCPSRLRSCSRLAAAMAPWAAATKPSQRHRSPSTDTRRWPGLS